MLSRAGFIPALGATSMLGALLWAGGLFAQVDGLDADDYASASGLATEVLLLDADTANGRIVAVGTRGHIVLSDDGGESWRQASSVPTRAPLTDLQFVDEKQGWAVGHDAVILHTRDGGDTWERQRFAPEDDAPLLAVWFENALHGIAVGAFGMLLETHDGGATWERRPLVEDDPEMDHHLNGIFGGEGDAVFIAAEFGSLFRSLDDGRSWERLEPGYEGSFWNGLVLGDGTLLIFGMRGHVFRSEDGGDSWEEIESGTELSLQSGIQLEDGRVVLVGLGGIILSSRDGGRSFTSAVQPDRTGIASVAQGSGGQLFLFGERGVKKPVAMPE
jgi:photosystem II stability/assembly factor-like uncharacterized protein